MGIRLLESLENGIHNFATESLPSNVTVIWDKPGEDRPLKPYLTLNFSSGPRPIGKPGIKYKSLDTWTYCWRKVITLSVSIVADSNYLNYLTQLLNGLDYEPYYEKLTEVGLASWGYEGPWDVSELIDSKYEFKANADITLSYGEDIDYVPGEIHSVNVNGQIVDINA